MTGILSDSDGFLIGDNEQPTQKSSAEDALLREIKGDTASIISLLQGTQGLQRDLLKATQDADKTKTATKTATKTKSTGAPPTQAPSRDVTVNQSLLRVNLIHPNRQPIVAPQAPNNSQANPLGQPPTPPINNPQPTVGRNRQRDANGRFVGANNGSQDSDNTSSPSRGNRDSRGRFVGGDDAAQRSAVSRITDGLKELNTNLTVNADTSRVDPMIDALKEVGGVASVGIEAGKKALSASNTLIMKPALALGRGVKGLFKPKTDAVNSPVAWYKRIWRTLERGNRQDQTQHNQEQRRLDELIRGQGQQGSSDSSLLMMLGLGLAGLGALMAKLNTLIPSLDSLLPDFLKRQDNQSPMPVVRVPKVSTPPITAYPPTRAQAMIARFNASPVGKVMTWLSQTRLGQAAGGVLKKLPLIGSALEAGAGGVNAVNIANDATLSEAQKERAQAVNAGRTVGAIGGGLGGAAAGAAIGTALIPILGTVIGGVLGGWLGTDGGRIVGGAIGGWVDDLRKADIAGRITNAWNGFITPLTPLFLSIKDAAVSVWQSVTTEAKTALTNTANHWNAFVEDAKTQFGGIMAGLGAVGDFFSNVGSTWNAWIKNLTGIDVAENLKQSKEAITNTVSKTVDNVNDAVGHKLDQAGQIASDVGDAIATTPLFEAVGGFFSGLTTETAKERQAKAKTKGFTVEKAKSIQATAEKLGVDPNYLAQIISFETGGTFNTNARNEKSSATGLIQFMGKGATAKNNFNDGTYNGMSRDQFGALSFDEQMVYVERYFKGRGIGKNGKTSLADMYDAVLGSGYKKGTKNYTANAGVDANKNGVIEKGEAINSEAFLPHRKLFFSNKTAAPTPPVANAATSAPPTATPTAPIAQAKTNTPTTPKVAPINAATSTSAVNQIPMVKAEPQATRLNSTTPTVKVAITKPLAGQNLADRGIAHIVTGGIGEWSV